MSTNKNKQQRINQASRNASLPHPDIYRDKPGRTTGCNYFAPIVRSIPGASTKTCYAPAPHEATIVLPAFAQSLSADREEEWLV